MENLDRGVVAVKVIGGVYVGWRMMGYEYNRTRQRHFVQPLHETAPSWQRDRQHQLPGRGRHRQLKYTVSAVIKGTEGRSLLRSRPGRRST